MGAQDTILTSTSETDSESVVAFNFGGSTGVLVILVTAVVVSFFLYQLCRCCMDGRCSRQQRPNNNNQGLNSAIITLALAVGHQQNVIQQQQHQQVQDHQLQQPTRVTPGYSYSTVNQTATVVMYYTVLYCTVLYCTGPNIAIITLNEKICLQENNRQTDKQTDRHGIRTLRPLYPHPNLPTNTYQAENSSKTEATLSPVVCGSSGNAGQH